MSKNFDIYNYVHNNKFTLKKEQPSHVTRVAKGYNDIRKTVINEVKIKDGKFSIKENLGNEKRPLSNEVKKHFLEIISTYNTFQDQMKRASDMTEVANTLGGIVEAAKELSLREAEDWFDAQTIKRNMSELDKLGKQFDKFAVEAKAMDERLHALYEDMGHILNRYYEISDIPSDVMKQRLGEKKNLSEGDSTNIGFINAVKMHLQRPDAFQGDKNIINKLKSSGVDSKEILSIISVMPRGSFKLDHIRNGMIDSKIKSAFIDSNVIKKKLMQVDALRDFTKVMDNEYGKDWPSKFKR